MTAYELIKEILANVDNPNAEVEFYNTKYEEYMEFDQFCHDPDHYPVQYVSLDFS